MFRIKLTKKEEEEYARLIEDDRNCFTVLDLLDQLDNFKGRLKTLDEKIAFIEFLSNIFHIKWEHDVYKRNHLRLFDLLVTMQYYTEKKKDQETKEIIENLFTRFEEIINKNQYEKPHAILADTKMLNFFKEHIPVLRKTEEFNKILIRYSEINIIENYDENFHKSQGEWPVGKRNHIILDDITLEPLRYDTASRKEYLKEWLNQRKQ